MRLTVGLVAAILLSWMPYHPAHANTLRFAFTSDLVSLDPHTVSPTFTLGFLANIYEGLVRRGPDLELEPALAERWEQLTPTRWRFHLRRGVTFHNGNAFTAEDVIFSAERALAPSSGVRARLAEVAEIVAVDDYTVEVETKRPAPLLLADWSGWFIMDKEWSLLHGAAKPFNIADPHARNYAARHANGTGPFRVVERLPGVHTVAERFEDWWDKAEHNLDRVVYLPIPTDAHRVDALLAGEVDLILRVPPQDAERVAAVPELRLLSRPDLRVLFLGMDQSRDELLYANVKGGNPFKDRRVREAFQLAIDIDTLVDVVLRGQAEPVAALVAPEVAGYPKGLARPPHDPERARELLAEAGYPNGFSLVMDCPNDRYVNDEAVCQAIIGMLARIGITAELAVRPIARHFGRVLAQGGFDTSFYLLGWTPTYPDSAGALRDLVHSRSADYGTFNLGGYANPELDARIERLLVESESGIRHGLAAEVWRQVAADVAYIPLYRQKAVWGVRAGIRLVQRADNQFLWRFVRFD